MHRPIKYPVLFAFMALITGCTNSNKYTQADQIAKNISLDHQQIFSYDYLQMHFAEADSINFTLETDSLFFQNEILSDHALVGNYCLPDTVMRYWFNYARSTPDMLSQHALFEGYIWENKMNTFNRIIPGFRYTTATKNELLVFYNYHLIAATNGGFWQIWIASFTADQKLEQINLIGIHGNHHRSDLVENDHEFYHTTYEHLSTSIIRMQDSTIQTTVMVNEIETKTDYNRDTTLIKKAAEKTIHTSRPFY